MEWSGVVRSVNSLYCIYIAYIVLTSSSSSYNYFRLPERTQKPIELATIKQQKENCKNEKIQKSNKNDLKNIYIKN